MKLKEVYCCDRLTGEIWRCHWLNTIADINSELRIPNDKAEELLRKSTIDEPVSLNHVDFWVE